MVWKSVETPSAMCASDGRGVSRRHSICSNPLKTDEYPQVQTMFWSSSRPLGVPSEAF